MASQPPSGRDGAGRRRRRCGWLAGLLALAAALAIGHWRTTDGGPIRRARGTFAGAVRLASTPSLPEDAALLALHNGSGEVTRVLYRRPPRLAPDYRIIVIYAGLTTGTKILELLPDRPDRVLLAVQYPYARPRTLPAKLRWIADIRLAAARSVAGGMLGLTFLEEVEGLDLDRTVVVGSSLGSIFAALHGALDERVPRVVLVHGGGDFGCLLPAQARATWQVPMAHALAAGPLYAFDPFHYIDRIAPRELFMIAARDDELFPARCTRALFEHAGQPKHLVWTESTHVRSRNRPLVDDLVAQIEAALTGTAAPVGRAEPPRRRAG